MGAEKALFFCKSEFALDLFFGVGNIKYKYGKEKAKQKESSGKS